MGLAIFILRILPSSWARALLRFLAQAAFVLGVRRRVALDNLRLAFPQMSEAERRDLARRNYRHLGRCAADFLRSPNLSDEELFALVDPGDWDEKVAPFLQEKKGFVVATAHFGNFELFGVYAARRGAPLTILTRELRGAGNARWVGTRALAGVKEIHRGMDALCDSVTGGDCLALLIDQNMLPKRAVFAPFFGQLAATTPAPAVVASRTGAPVVIALMPLTPDGRYRVRIEGPFVFTRSSDDLQKDVLAFTAMLNERFERFVREQPEQWFWVHRRWKTRPEDGQRMSEAADASSTSAKPSPRQ